MATESNATNNLPTSTVSYPRRFAFYAIFFFMIATPVRYQIMQVESRFLRGWTMFSITGANLCGLEVRERADGRETHVDWYSFLAKKNPGKVIAGRRIESLQEAEEIGKSLCKLSRTSPPDLRLYTRCMNNGWQWYHRGESNVCA